MNIVVDASVAIKWVIEEHDHHLALTVLRNSARVVVPDLIFSECANVLFKKLKRKEVSSAQALAISDSLATFFSEVVATAALVSSAVRLAESLNHPAYDCMYLACAEQMDLTLVSADVRFVRKVRESAFSRRVIDLSEAASWTG